MASAQTALPKSHRISSNGNGSATTLDHMRTASLSSFPASSRSGSQISHLSHHSRPVPPAGMVSETDRTSNPSSKSKTPSTGTGVSSQHSSLSAGALPHRYNPDAHPPRRLKSQYPRGSDTENHVEYILVASFDIDKGSIMEHQYPVAITGDEHMLAELMLPDGAHMRNQDWTMFFLHKDTSQEEEDDEKKAKQARKRRRRRGRNRAAGSVDDEDEEEEEGDEDDTLAEDDDDDGTDDDDLSSEGEPEGGEGPPLIHVLNLVNTKQDKTVRRGAIVKAMAICTRHPFLHIYKVCGIRDSVKVLKLSCYSSRCCCWPWRNTSSLRNQRRWRCYMSP